MASPLLSPSAPERKQATRSRLLTAVVASGSITQPTGASRGRSSSGGAVSSGVAFQTHTVVRQESSPCRLTQLMRPTQSTANRSVSPASGRIVGRTRSVSPATSSRGPSSSRAAMHTTDVHQVSSALDGRTLSATTSVPRPRMAQAQPPPSVRVLGVCRTVAPSNGVFTDVQHRTPSSSPQRNSRGSLGTIGSARPQRIASEQTLRPFRSDRSSTPKGGRSGSEQQLSRSSSSSLKVTIEPGQGSHRVSRNSPMSDRSATPQGRAMNATRGTLTHQKSAKDFSGWKMQANSPSASPGLSKKLNSGRTAPVGTAPVSGSPEDSGGRLHGKKNLPDECSIPQAKKQTKTSIGGDSSRVALTKSLELGCGFAKSSTNPQQANLPGAFSSAARVGSPGKEGEPKKLYKVAAEVTKQLQIELERAVGQMLEIHNRVECAQADTEREADELQKQLKVSIEKQTKLCEILQRAKAEEAEERERRSAFEENMEMSTMQWAKSAFNSREAIEDVGELRTELAEVREKSAQSSVAHSGQDLDLYLELKLRGELHEVEAEGAKAEQEEQKATESLREDVDLLRSELSEANMLLEHSGLMGNFEDNLVFPPPCESASSSGPTPEKADTYAPRSLGNRAVIGDSVDIAEKTRQEAQDIAKQVSNLRTNLHAAEVEVADLREHIELCEETSAQMQRRLTSEIGVLCTQLGYSQPEAQQFVDGANALADVATRSPPRVNGVKKAETNQLKPALKAAHRRAFAPLRQISPRPRGKSPRFASQQE